MSFELYALRHCLSRAKRNSTKLHDALCQNIGMPINLGPETIKHFMHGDELASPQIPMRLLRHQGEIDRIGQAGVEQSRDGGPGVGIQIVSGFWKLQLSNPSGADCPSPLYVEYRAFVHCQYGLAF